MPLRAFFVMCGFFADKNVYAIQILDNVQISHKLNMNFLTFVFILFCTGAFWLLSGLIAWGIIRSNYHSIPISPKRREDLLPLIWARQWKQAAFLYGPGALMRVLYDVIFERNGFKLGFSLRPLPRYQREEIEFARPKLNYSAQTALPKAVFCISHNPVSVRQTQMRVR
ncbi:MAG: hypothetical protein A2928_00790 [Candidatus Taylorbacteria bacterium RIFCSPLOWO2_01_FULL_45_15b]|uniref:Uncharacterized protein n=1 Tax=Candidatus Taylorbacteria bacterium RIFCSPLOWO2_01_FULL_45_15b TaxID=1802319 RepID=A0A1G2NA98_9BACT|nr:MAG: hypothetical protein A2928_00790 [Candidatus Taylorbacteria bacterium RIFCSPLOWO2_01_FULL_45_15b]